MVRHRDIGQRNDIDFNGYDGLQISIDVLHIVVAAKPVPLDPVSNHIWIKAALSVCPVVGRAVSVHLVGDAGFDKVQRRAAAAGAAGYIHHIYPGEVAIEIA